jgi:hypothetical protein
LLVGLPLNPKTPPAIEADTAGADTAGAASAATGDVSGLWKSSLDGEEGAAGLIGESLIGDTATDREDPGSPADEGCE